MKAKHKGSLQLLGDIQTLIGHCNKLDGKTQLKKLYVYKYSNVTANEATY